MRRARSTRQMRIPRRIDRGDNRARHQRRRGNREKRQIALRDQSQMQPAQTEKNIRESPVPRVPQGRQQRQDHQGLEIDHCRRVKVHRLEFADVLQLVGVGDVLDDVLVQLPAVGVDEGDREASRRRRKPWSGRTQELPAALAFRLDRRVQEIRADIAGKHQEDHEKTAVQICPQQRQGNQPREQVSGTAARPRVPLYAG